MCPVPAGPPGQREAVLDGIQVKRPRHRQEVSVTQQIQLADYLVAKGVPFREVTILLVKRWWKPFVRQTAGKIARRVAEIQPGD